MSKYTFRIKQILYGELDIEIGDQDPDKYINERIEMGLNSHDYAVLDDDTECEWFNKFPEPTPPAPLEDRKDNDE